MNYQEITLQLPTNYNETELNAAIAKILNIKNFSYQIIGKSLDARKKNNIHWQIKVAIAHENSTKEPSNRCNQLHIPIVGKGKKVIIAGSGPAGFFAAYVLQKAGFTTTIIERGLPVKERAMAIQDFEKNGIFHANANYAFGEGGAGTFSDGKLTSRSKHINAEREFVIDSYIEAGAPEEIRYLAHPHLGTDNLKIIVQKLRQTYVNIGGSFEFNTLINNIEIKNNNVYSISSGNKAFEANYYIFATGHSAFETYKMLISKGIPFRTKNFAIGFRLEHLQETINIAQWGKPKLHGVKAAEYRLTSEADGKHPVYTFCMCPGGIVVPATAYANNNIVNGMSYYQRDGKFANAAIVAGVHPDELLNKKCTPQEILNWLEALEKKTYDFAGNYMAPASNIKDFINNKIGKNPIESSFPLGVIPTSLHQFIPKNIANSIKYGLIDFNKKLKGFENGNLLGLETKTSAPVQCIRNKQYAVEGFENLYISGEASGFAGGIISSAADGIKAAMAIIANQ